VIDVDYIINPMEKVVLLIITIVVLVAPAPNDDVIVTGNIKEFPDYDKIIKAGYLTITA
jgi:hypothetical protein